MSSYSWYFLIEEFIKSFEKEQVQFHDSADSLVQSQLKGIIPNKHYTCFHWRPFHNAYNIEKHTCRKQYSVGKIVIKENGAKTGMLHRE